MHITIIKFVGRGMVGCTPAGAGAGTSKGYTWCRFSYQNHWQQEQPVKGELVIDSRTSLPLRFGARAINRLGPVLETATFTYQGRYHVRLPAGAKRIPCLSWVPAMHCIELHRVPKAG